MQMTDMYKIGHDAAARALTVIRNAESVNIIPVGKSTFEAATAQFIDYDAQQISVVDHTTTVLAAERDIEHIFAFDSDFRTLGFSLVPDDVSFADG